MTNPYVFIVGCPRSGTTLLRHILSAHPELVITPEAHWIPLWYEERRGVTSEGVVEHRLVNELLNHPKFALFHIGSEQLASLESGGTPMTYSDFVSGIFDMYGISRGKRLVGNKTPDSVRRMRTLHSLWPEARFIHLIRDGRDVALSLMNWPKVKSKKPGTFPTWGEDPVTTASLWWELNVRRGMADARTLPPELYHEIRYESLVSDPERECKELCEFLDIAYDPMMLRWNELDPLPLEGSGSLRTAKIESAGEKGWLPISKSLRDWRSQMPIEDVERFEAAAGSLLRELGYPTKFSEVRPEAAEHSERIRSRLAGVPVDVRPYGT